MPPFGEERRVRGPELASARAGPVRSVTGDPQAGELAGQPGESELACSLFHVLPR